MSNITICEAQEGDLVSLSTVVPRAFHPVNAHFRKMFPDTEAMRGWWRQIFASGSADAAFHVLVAIDGAAADPAKRVIGVLLLQLCSGTEDKAAEFWTKQGFTPDHSPELFMASMAPMIEHRARLMEGRPHHVVQLFGVDHAYQRAGVGTMMLQRACAIADQQGNEVFVEANMRAAPFYLRFGFKLHEEIPLPGETPYAEGILVRPYKPQKH